MNPVVHFEIPAGYVATTAFDASASDMTQVQEFKPFTVRPYYIAPENKV